MGRAIKGARDGWVLATKLANVGAADANGAGTSRKWMMRAVEGSLSRLGTDYIDVYYLHKEDHRTPLGETVRAMADLVRQGKVRYFGCRTTGGGAWPRYAGCATRRGSTGPW